MAIDKQDKETGRDKLKNMFNNGIRLSYAKFKQPVLNAFNTPENAFHNDSNVKTRRVEMSWNPHAILFKQEGKFFGTPMSNVVDYFFDVGTKE